MWRKQKKKKLLLANYRILKKMITDSKTHPTQVAAFSAFKRVMGFGEKKMQKQRLV